MRAVFIFGALLSTLCGCAFATQYSQSDKDIAVRGMVACLRSAAARLDDHMSDASSVAEAVVGACSAQINGSIKVEGANLSWDGYEQFQKQVRAGIFDMAVQAVLLERSRRKN